MSETPEWQYLEQVKAMVQARNEAAENFRILANERFRQITQGLIQKYSLFGVQTVSEAIGFIHDMSGIKRSESFPMLVQLSDRIAESIGYSILYCIRNFMNELQFEEDVPRSHFGARTRVIDSFYKVENLDVAASTHLEESERRKQFEEWAIDIDNPAKSIFYLGEIEFLPSSLRSQNATISPFKYTYSIHEQKWVDNVAIHAVIADIKAKISRYITRTQYELQRPR